MNAIDEKLFPSIEKNESIFFMFVTVLTNFDNAVWFLMCQLMLLADL